MAAGMPNREPPDTDRAPDGPRFDRLLGSVDEGLWEHNLVTGATWYSRRFRHLLGFAGSEWPEDASVLRLRVHPDDLAGFDAVRQRAVHGGLPPAHAMRLLCRDGHWRWFRTRIRVWPDASGRPTHLVGTLHDVDHEVRTVAELGAVTQRFERAIAASEEGLFDAVWGNEKVYLSDRARELMGLAPGPSQVAYAELRRRIHPEDLDTVRQDVAAAVAGLTRWQSVFRAERFDRQGEFRWFRERGTAAREADGRIRVWGLIADITETISETERLESRVARRTAELAEALRLAEAQRQAAEGANRAKASFLGQMSHELRTPLNGVIGMTELVLRSGVTPEQRRFLDLAQQSARSMLHVVEDLLDFARAEAGRLTLDPQPFDLARLLADTFREFMPGVRERGLSMLFDYIGEPVDFIGDASRIAQMVSNLIGNAVKFTDSGRVSVQGRVLQMLPPAAGKPRRALLSIEVADTGPGMDPDTAQRVFEAFEQGDATIGRRHGGAGLGLSIVRMLADLMGGQVSVQTRLGEGSTFRIELELPLAPAVARPGCPPTGSVWVVHRDERLAPWLTGRLERLGWRVRVLPSIEASVQAITADPADPPGAVLVTEPAIEAGGSLGELVGLVPATTPVTLLVRPDYPAADVLASAEAVGCGVSLAPYTADDLRALLRPRAPAASMTATPAEPRPTGVATVPPPGPADPPAPPGRVLVVEDNPVNRLIVREMLASMGIECDDADSGEEAILACERDAPALVLMDVQMPGLDGLQTTQRLRALQRQGRLAPFPIVALTAHAMPGDREASLAAGMDDHLTKPIHFDALKQAVVRHLRMAER